MHKTFFSNRHSDSETRLLCFAKKKGSEGVPDASNPEHTKKKSKAEIRNEKITQLTKENAELKEKLKTIDDLKKEVEALKQQTKQVATAPFAPYNTPGNGTLLPGQQLKGPFAAVPGAINAANQARVNTGYPTAADPRRIYAQQHRTVQNVPVEQPVVFSPAPTSAPTRGKSYYDRATRMMVHTDADGNVRMERLEDVRARLDARHAEITYRNQMQHNQNVANGRLVQNWRSDPVSTEHRLKTERTAAQFGMTPDQMYKPVTGTEANFARHVQRGVRGGNPVFMNQSGNDAYIDNDIPRTRIDQNTGMKIDARGQYNEYMAANNPAEVLGMPNAQILSDDATSNEKLFPDARGIYGKRANRAPAGNITPFNKIDTNTPESQKQITDFYQGENIQRLQSGEFDDLKTSKNPAVRTAYHEITSAFNDGIMKRGEVTYGDTALARTRMENLRRNAGMLEHNDRITGPILEQRFYPVRGFAGDAPVMVTFESDFKGRKEKHQISIHDPRMWGDGIYGARGSADFAAEAGIHVRQEKFSDGRIRGLTLEFTKPGKFDVSGPKNGSGRGGWENEQIVVKAPEVSVASNIPASRPVLPVAPVPPEEVPNPVRDSAAVFQDINRVAEQIQTTAINQLTNTSPENRANTIHALNIWLGEMNTYVRQLSSEKKEKYLTSLTSKLEGTSGSNAIIFAPYGIRMVVSADKTEVRFDAITSTTTPPITPAPINNHPVSPIPSSLPANSNTGPEKSADKPNTAKEDMHSDIEKRGGDKADYTANKVEALSDKTVADALLKMEGLRGSDEQITTIINSAEFRNLAGRATMRREDLANEVYFYDVRSSADKSTTVIRLRGSGYSNVERMPLADIRIDWNAKQVSVVRGFTFPTDEFVKDMDGKETKVRKKFDTMTYLEDEAERAKEEREYVSWVDTQIFGQMKNNNKLVGETTTSSGTFFEKIFHKSLKGGGSLELEMGGGYNKEKGTAMLRSVVVNVPRGSYFATYKNGVNKFHTSADISKIADRSLEAIPESIQMLKQTESKEVPGTDYDNQMDEFIGKDNVKMNKALKTIKMEVADVQRNSQGFSRDFILKGEESPVISVAVGDTSSPIRVNFKDAETTEIYLFTKGSTLEKMIGEIPQIMKEHKAYKDALQLKKEVPTPKSAGPVVQPETNMSASKRTPEVKPSVTPPLKPTSLEPHEKKPIPVNPTPEKVQSVPPVTLTTPKGIEKPEGEDATFPEIIETKQHIEQAIASLKVRAEKSGNKEVVALFSNGSGRVQEMGPGKKPQMLFKKEQIDTLKSMQSDVAVKSVLGVFLSVEDSASLLKAVNRKLETPRTTTRRGRKSTSEKPADALDAIKSASENSVDVSPVTNPPEQPADATEAIQNVSKNTIDDSASVSAVLDTQDYPADALDVASMIADLTPEQKQMLTKGEDASAYEDFLTDPWNKSETTLKPALDKLLEQARKTTNSPSSDEKHADAAMERALLRENASMWLDSNVKYIFIGRVQHLNSLINEEQTPEEIEKEFRDYINS